MPAMPAILSARPSPLASSSSPALSHSIGQAISSVQILLFPCLLLLGACWRFRRLLKRKMESPEKAPASCPSCPSPRAESPPIKPVYPWILPPKPLPGPYDPRLFPPLPPPTIRPHSIPDPNLSNTDVVTATYTCRVPTHGPDSERIIYGEVIKAGPEGGWRRNQWTVQGG